MWTLARCLWGIALPVAVLSNWACCLDTEQKYRIPAGFEQLVSYQEADIDLILAGKVVGQGHIEAESSKLRITRLKITSPAFKPDALQWLKEQLEKGITGKELTCSHALSARLGCVQGNRLLLLQYSAEKLTATLEVDVALLAAADSQSSHFLPKSSSPDFTAAVNYSLSHSCARNRYHLNLQTHGVLGMAEKHVKASLRNVDNRTENRSDQYGLLQELVFRHDNDGSFFSAGLQQQWNFYGELAGGHYFHPRQDVIALVWGDSDRTNQRKKLSAIFPVQVFMPQAGLVEVYRDEALLATEIVGAGMNSLNTSFWPQGVYDIEIHTFINGQQYDIQRQTVFKDGSDQSLPGKSFWLGVDTTQLPSVYGDASNGVRAEYSPMLGSSFSYPFSKGLSLNGASYFSSKSSAVEMGGRMYLWDRLPLTLSSMITQHQSYGLLARLSATLWDTSLSGAYERFHAQHEQDRRQFMSERKYFSSYLSRSLAQGRQITFSFRRNPLHQSNAVGVDFRERWKLDSETGLESKLSLLYRRAAPGTCRESSVADRSGFSFNLTLTMMFRDRESSVQNRLAWEYASSRQKKMAASGSHYQTFDDHWLRQYSITGRVTSGHYQLWSDAGLRGDFADGSVGGGIQGGEKGQHWSLFSNLSGQYALTENTSVWGRGQGVSGAILSVNKSGKHRLKADVDGRKYPLSRDNLLISLQPYRTYRMKILPDDTGDNKDDILLLDRDFYQYTLYPGNIVQLDIDSWSALDVLGRIVNEQGQPVSGLRLYNSRGQAATDENGMFSMTFDQASLEFRAIKGQQQCELDITETVRAQGQQPFYRVGSLFCRLK